MTMPVPDGVPVERGVVRAPDGTRLSYRRLGDGPSLVVCNGSFSMADEWLRFAEHLALAHTVYLYDRRGRGLSPSAAGFAVDAEVDDLAEIVELAGPETAVLGHSFGGGCALSLAARGRLSGQLILYEPRHSMQGPVSRGFIPAIEQLVAAGDKHAAVEFVLSHVVRLPAEAIAAFRQSPQWMLMCQTVDAFPNELRLLDSLTWRPEDFAGVTTAPILLVGEKSPVPPNELSREAVLRPLLPAIRTIILPGQGHFAYVAEPTLLADIITHCLRS